MKNCGKMYFIISNREEGICRAEAASYLKREEYVLCDMISIKFATEKIHVL